MTRRTHELVQAGEGIAELLAMMTWIVFGAVAVGQSWLGMTWPVLIYSLLSLTVIRMLPNILALTRSGEGWEPKFFLGWFGPRGLASIVFFVIVANAHLPGESIMKSVVVCTITLCIFAHGVTANAWAKRMANSQSNTSN
jgi:NhaP-type Na+/H+ or K+/H+ antiporter